jgi:hypothetical protein
MKMNKIVGKKKEEGKNINEFISFIVKIDRAVGTFLFVKCTMKLYFIILLVYQY